MIDLVKKHPLASLLSLVLHLILIGFFIFSTSFNEPGSSIVPPVPIVKATVIDDSKIKAEAEKLKNQALEKKQQEKKRLDDLKNKRLAEENKLAELKKEQALEQQKLEQHKAEQAASAAKLKKQQAIDEKKKADATKQLLIAKEKAAKEKAIKEKAAEENRAKAQAIKEKAAKEKLAKEKAAKEKAAKALAAKEQAARERALNQLAEQEEQEMRAQEAVASYSGLIRQKVERNWLQPPGDITGLSCTVRVRLIPGGDVIDVQVIKSSGNTYFDRSVELATRKASPLPLPNDPAMFNYFRTLDFYFRPGG